MIGESVDIRDVNKILTIRNPMCYSNRALGLDSNSQNKNIYNGLIREIGLEMRRKNRNNFFHTCYPELIRAHSTGNKSDVNKLCAKLQIDLKPYAAKLASSFPFTAIDLNDFIQEGLIAIVEYLPKYRYICPKCSEEFERVDSYKEHCINKHDHLMEPVQGIKPFLSGIIRGYMLNFLRYQFQLKRTPFATIPHSKLFDLEKHVAASGPTSEDVVVSKQVIERVKVCLDRERNEKIRVFIERILEGATVQEAYSGMNQQGLSTSIESARITIFHLKQRTKSFVKYRQALAG